MRPSIQAKQEAAQCEGTDAKQPQKCKSLWHACRSGTAEALETLIQAKADVMQADADGLRCLHVTLQRAAETGVNGKHCCCMSACARFLQMTQVSTNFWDVNAQTTYVHAGDCSVTVALACTAAGEDKRFLNECILPSAECKLFNK